MTRQIGRPHAGTTRREALAVLGTGIAGLVPASVRAQPLDRPASIVTGFPAGGSADVTARLLAEKFRGKLAPTVLVENKPGAGGRIAVESVKGAPADGSSILLTPQGMMALFPHIYRQLRYDPLKDFTPVTMVVRFPFVIGVSQKVSGDVRTVDELLRWCRANPASASFGSPGEGTSAHFGGMMLGRAAQVPLAHIPYKGMAPLVQDLLGAQVAFGILTPADATPLLASGRVRILATTGAERSPFMPDVPTLAESGFRSIVIEEMYGLFVPAATPSAMVERLAVLTREAVAEPDVKSRLSQLSLEPVGSSPAHFRAFIQAQHERWGGIVKASGFAPSE